MTRIGIFTHDSRPDILDRTIRSLADVGLEPHFISVDTGRGSSVKNRLNAVNALRNTFDGNDVLILEDDVIAGRYLPEWLEYLHYNANSVTCLLPMKTHFYQESTEVYLRNRRERPIGPSRLEVNPQLQHWWGSQAMWLPPRIAKGILADDRFDSQEHAPLGPWDHAIRLYLLEREEDMLCAFPAVFQHQSPPSVRERQNRRQRLAAVFDPNAKAPS